MMSPEVTAVTEPIAPTRQPPKRIPITLIVSSPGSIVVAEDIAEIKGALEEIWRLQRLNLLKVR